MVERPLARGVAFCSTTDPGTRSAWAIPESHLDDCTRSNPLVTGKDDIRSYTAAPLVTRDGHTLGAICVFDHRPRDFTARQLATLTDLADLTMHELDLRAATRRALSLDR